MIDREKVIRHITAELCIARTCKKDFASVDIDMLSDALGLLKEQEEHEKQICKKICAFIMQGCSTDTDADKAHVCNVIQQCFFHSESGDANLALVISGLQHCDSAGCIGCPYYDENADESCELNKDALKLINEQAEKIKSLEQTIEDICCGGS